MYFFFLPPSAISRRKVLFIWPLPKHSQPVIFPGRLNFSAISFAVFCSDTDIDICYLHLKFVVKNTIS